MIKNFEALTTTYSTTLCIDAVLHLENIEEGGGQICEQGSFEGAGFIRELYAHGKLGGVWGHAPPGNF